MNSILPLILIAIIIFVSWLIVRPTAVRPGMFLVISINHIQIKGVITMVSLTSTQQVSGQLQPTNRLGNPAPVEAGSVLIQSSDTNVVEVVRDEADETKFQLKAKNDGVATISFAADADLGEGVTTIGGSTNVEVVAAAAAGFGVVFGQPEEQPAPAE
jgi:hypothetical protein